MYTPKFNQVTDRGVLIEAMQAYSFAILFGPLLQATHLFLFRNTDKYRINRMAEFAGSDSAELRKLIPTLPRHEFVYVDTRTGLLLRSMVMLEHR